MGITVIRPNRTKTNTPRNMQSTHIIQGDTDIRKDDEESADRIAA